MSSIENRHSTTDADLSKHNGVLAKTLQSPSWCVSASKDKPDNAEHKSALEVPLSRTGQSITSITSNDSGYEPGTGSTRNSHVFEEAESPLDAEMCSKTWRLQKPENSIVENECQSPSSSNFDVIAPTAQHDSGRGSLKLELLDVQPIKNLNLVTSADIVAAAPENECQSLSSSRYVTAPTSQRGSESSSFDISPLPIIPPLIDNFHLATLGVVLEEEKPVSKTDRPFLSRKAPSLSKCGKSQSVEPVATKQRPSLRRASNTEPLFDKYLLKKALIDLQTKQQDLEEIYESVLKQVVADKASVFRDTLDFKVLLAHLFEHKLVHTDECEFLNSQGFTNLDKANKFLFEILSKKGSNAYRCFYYALSQEKQHKGHDELVELMTVALYSLAE